MSGYGAWSASASFKTPDPAVPAISRDSFPNEMFEHGWSNSLAELLGMGKPDYFFGRNSTALVLIMMCADVKARDISKAEMLLYKRRGGRARGYDIVEPTDHPIARMLALRPNQWQTWPEFWRMVTLHLEIVQNAYLLKDGFRRDGSFTGLIPIQPGRCRVRVGASGGLFYDVYAGNEYQRAQLGADWLIVPAERMIHLRGRLWDGLYGMSTLALGEPLLDLASAISEFQRSLFSNDGQQVLAFETEAAFGNDQESDAAFNRLKRQLGEKLRKAKNFGDPMLLEAGLKANVISWNAKDSEAKDAFEQTILRICGLTNTPPHKISALASVAYNNQSAANRAYYNDCLDPLAVLMQEALRLGMFTEDEALQYSPQFDQIKLMANDIESLDKILKTAMQNGLLLVDEAREILPFRFGQIKGGNTRHVPVNMTIIDDTGKIVVTGNAGQRDNNPGSGEQGDGSGDNAPADETGKIVPLRA